MTTDVILNKVFTVNYLKKLINDQGFGLYQDVVDSLISEQKVDNNLDAFVALYKYMFKNHRNEFFYKNTLIKKILLGIHSVNTTTALREIPISENILDLLLINGVGRVYEIKTELDNLTRLPQQLEAYYQAFSYVNVVTDESHFKDVSKLLEDKPTGIILLTKRGSLHVEKKALEYNGVLNSRVLFNILRKYEFENITNEVFGQLPQVNQSKYYDACFEMLSKLDVKEFQWYVLRELKKRSNINSQNLSAFETIPKEIKSLVYFSKYRPTDFEKLQKFLETDYKEVK
ncbi:hypothetical protein EGT49_08055 [Companilactobacillus suantsaicola]|uniref:Sce7726 family protein n=1 Tax=Companilactobacillus suantsaicola TaxID=2487723 RepID=A0A4Z0JL37_9LACO|nr:sce7726 family protein [Companilactobacillus suantsaicola]TGD22724.1 hypothetical protein EGT49_08055 [Companilactobacillus suantsaicola]